MGNAHAFLLPYILSNISFKFYLKGKSLYYRYRLLSLLFGMNIEELWFETQPFNQLQPGFIFFILP
jgi:hypothetical protein